MWHTISEWKSLQLLELSFAVMVLCTLYVHCACIAMDRYPWGRFKTLLQAQSRRTNFSGGFHAQL